MKYSEALMMIGASLQTRKFRGTRGLYTREISSDLGHWLAISGNDYMLTPNLGVVSYPVNAVAKKLLAEVYSQYPGRKVANKRGPPLVIVPLNVLIPSELRAPGPAAWEGRAPLNEATIEAFIASFNEVAEGFYSQNVNLASALASAEVFCRFRPGQDHLIPIAMALCGRISEISAYGDARSAMLSSNPELADLFKKYIGRVIDELS